MYRGNNHLGAKTWPYYIEICDKVRHVIMRWNCIFKTKNPMFIQFALTYYEQLSTILLENVHLYFIYISMIRFFEIC